MSARDRLLGLRAALMFARLTAVVAVLAAAFSATAAAQGTGATRAAIIGGWDDLGHPYVVALMRDGNLICSGTLIAPDLVLTAAHCVDILDPAEVVFGPDPGAPEERIRVASTSPHPSFERTTLSHDIALVHLAHDATVTPAELPPYALEEDRIGSEARIVGYGAPASGALADLSKREGSTRIDSIDHYTFRVTGAPSQPCRGDSGGPTFLQMAGAEPVVGIHSGGEADCTGGSVETRVDAYLDFIDSHMRTPYGGGGSNPSTITSSCAVTRGSPRSSGALWLGMALVIAAWRRFEPRRSARRSREALTRER